MKKIIKILRRTNLQKAPYWQSFLYESENENATPATALTELNQREPLTDIDGNAAQPIRWECSCLQKKCGACAMLINGLPALACDVKLSCFSKSVVDLAPLEKFPVVEDLIVDRSILFNNLKDLRVWLDEDAVADQNNIEDAFEASRCLQCGCCLEICISFMPGGEFMGTAAMVPAARLLSVLPHSGKKPVSKAYRKHIYEGCDKYNACHQICPAGIDTDRLMAHSDEVALLASAKETM